VTLDDDDAAVIGESSEVQADSDMKTDVDDRRQSALDPLSHPPKVSLPGSPGRQRDLAVEVLFASKDGSADRRVSPHLERDVFATRGTG